MAKRLFTKTIVRVHPGPLLTGKLSTLFFLFIAFIAFGISLLHPASVSGLRVSAADLLSPAIHAINQPIEHAASFVRNFSGIAAMQAENDRLALENAKLKQWYQKALTLQAQNETLQKLMNFQASSVERYISSYVVADAGNSYVKSLLAPVGTDQGVTKGQGVLSGEGLVGRIVETGSGVSRILLITDVNSRVPVLIEGTGKHAVLSGQNNDTPTLMHYKPDTMPAVGARIITSGHGGVLPPGLPIGTVANIDDGEILIRPYANANKIHNIKILQASTDPNLRQGILAQ